jgi:hypothetical protein
MARVALESSPAEADVLKRLGLLDATTMVVSSNRRHDRRSLDASLDFIGPRRGAAAWLAAPAPMGSLEYVSPAASVVVAAVSEDAAVIFDQLVAAVIAQNAQAEAELAEFERLVGIDLRADLAATLGGEGAFAIDGPVLPVPSWKLIVEVYDPETLIATLDRAVAEINHQLAERGQPPLSFDETVVSGRSYRVLRHPSSSSSLALLATDGYLLVAPGTALIDQALHYRSSGASLPRSPAFQELLPRDGFTDCSAVVWRNLGGLLASMPEAAVGALPPEAHALLEDGGGPGLICAYGTDTRIIASGGGDGLLSSVPLAAVIGSVAGSGPRTDRTHEPLSSGG